MAMPTWTSTTVRELTQKVRQYSLTEAEIDEVIEDCRYIAYGASGLEGKIIGSTTLARAVARALDRRFRLTGQQAEPVEVIRKRLQDSLRAAQEQAEHESAMDAVLDETFDPMWPDDED